MARTKQAARRVNIMPPGSQQKPVPKARIGMREWPMKTSTAAPSVPSGFQAWKAQQAAAAPKASAAPKAAAATKRKAAGFGDPIAADADYKSFGGATKKAKSQDAASVRRRAHGRSKTPKGGGTGRDAFTQKQWAKYLLANQKNLKGGEEGAGKLASWIVSNKRGNGK